MNDVKRRAYFNYLMLINMFCKTTTAKPVAVIGKRAYGWYGGVWPEAEGAAVAAAARC